MENTNILEEINLPGLNQGDAVMEFDGDTYNTEVSKTCRMWPQDNDTEGFFICKIIKNKQQEDKEE